MAYASLKDEAKKSKQLATYDYNTALNNHEKQAKRKYPYKFKSLSSEFRTQFNKLINDTKNIHDSAYLTPDERDSEQKRAQVKAAFDWMSFNKNKLDTTFFHPLSATIDKKISSLQSEWQSLSYTAMLTNQQLSNLANDTLPNLIAKYNLARIEFNKKRRKLPKDIRYGYGTHLSSISASIQHLKNDIAYGMHYRLNLIDIQSSFSNCVHVFVSKLVENNLEKKKYLDTAKDFLNYSDQLSSEDYQTFASYIETNGSDKLKEKLHALSCYESNPFISFRKPNATQNKRQLVPTALQQNVPAKKAVFLFKGHNLRHSFFENKLGFLLSINQPINFETLPLYSRGAIDAQFKSLSQIKINIRQEIKKHNEEIKKFSAGWFPDSFISRFTDRLVSWFNRHFRQETLAFMEQYAQFLQTADNVRFKNKMKLIKRTASSLIALDDNKEVNLNYFLDTVNLINNKIHKAQSKLDKPKYERYKTKLLALDENMPVINLKTDIIPVLTNSTNSLDDNIILASDFSNSVSAEISANVSANVSAGVSASDLSASIKALRGTIHSQNFADIASHYKILCYAQELKIDDAINALEKMLPKMFLFFLQELLLDRLDEKLIRQYEEFFLKFGHGAKYLNDTFSQHMQQIKKYQNQQNSSSYHSHCQALAVGLNKELFIKRFTKDAKSLDDHIELALSTHAEQAVKNGNGTHNSVDSYLTALVNIRDSAVKQESTVNVAPLSESEQALLEPVKGLIELSVQSHILKKKILPTCLFLNNDSREKHAQLHDSLSAFLKSENRPQGNARFGLAASEKRQLFSKNYLEPEALTRSISRK